MRDFHLRFACNTIADLGLGPEASGWFDNDDYTLFDLLTGEISDVPDEPGAYVLGTADGTMLIYPWGTSPVYYIGMANNLAARLSAHSKHTQGAIDDHAAGAWWPRYQYAAAFGAHAVWYFTGEVEPKSVEAELVSCFYNEYGSIPVANGAWPQFLKVKNPVDD